MSIILPTKILTGTVGDELVVKASGTEASFGPKCEKIPKKNQFWSIQPNLPEGLLMDSATGIISGRTEEKINSTFTLRVTGSGNEFEEKLELQSEPSYDTWLEKCTSDPYFLASILNAFFPDALDSRALNPDERSSFRSESPMRIRP